MILQQNSIEIETIIVPCTREAALYLMLSIVIRFNLQLPVA